MALPVNVWSLSGPSTSSQRSALVNFWLTAPHDQIEALWNSGFGSISRQSIITLATDHVFTDDQVQLRLSIQERLGQIGLENPLSLQLMLANFLLSPPGLITINNVDSYFPKWFVDSYNELYLSKSVVDCKSPSSTHQNDDADNLSSLDQLSAVPQLGPFPSSLQELIGDRLQLNRLLGLSNLYYIDPEDKEISADLLVIRRSLVDAIATSPEQQLEHFWSTEFGDRYWALVRSGIQNEPECHLDITRKQKALDVLNPSLGGGFSSPGALNAFLIVMLYLLPGTMKVDNAEQKIPSWLFPSYKEVFAEALSV